MKTHRQASNLWPVAAYTVAFAWLVLVNVENLPALGLRIADPAAYYGILGQFDAIVHYMVALSLASIGAQTSLGRRGTAALVVGLILLWEVFEALTQPFLSNLPSITGTAAYYADTLEDIAIGIIGVLTGVSAEGSNRSGGI